MATDQDLHEDTPSYVDFSALEYQPQFAANCIGLTPRRLMDIERDYDIEIRRVARGTVSARMYTPSDIFRISALRRELGHAKRLARQVVVSIFVQKGGTAKTTTAVNLGIAAQFSGLKTLIIDNDPQGDTSSMLGYDPDLAPEDLKNFGIPLDRLVDGHLGNLIAPHLQMRSFEAKRLDQVVKKPFGEYGPHLIPADAYMEDLVIALDVSPNPDMRYAKWIQLAISGKIPGCDLSDYDLIIFDNAPAGSRLTKNSVAASDLLLCPVRMDKFSSRALVRLNDWCARFAEEYNFAPDMLAIPTMFFKGRTALQENLARLNSLFPNRVTEEKIYFSEDYSKSLNNGVPLLLWKGASTKSLDPARKVFEEVIAKIRDIGSH
ncbi:ParA family protein [Pseudomonas japonica]|nr:ParA family protein [Pseudomonas japonica]MBA1245489.1 ParA family protein [Pseudomonas japonica]